MSSNIFTLTFSRFKRNQTFYEIALDCKKEVNLTILKSINLRVFEILQKYDALHNKYLRGKYHDKAFQWKEQQKKLFLCLLMAFCHLYCKKHSQITQNQWSQMSKAFNNKNILLLKYQAKVIEKNCQRVIWDEKEELLLHKFIQNKMLGKWAEISRLIFFQSEGQYFKTSKQCRQHWFNHLNKSIKHGVWEIEQDLVILYSALDYGHRWARVVEALEKTRTQHMIKNRFYSLLTNSTKCNPQEKMEDKDEGKIIRRLINELNEKKARQKEPLQKSNTDSNEMNEIGEKTEHFPQNQVYLKIQNSQEDQPQGAERHFVDKESTEKEKSIEKVQQQQDQIDVKIKAEGVNSEITFNHQSHTDNWVFNNNFYNNPFMASSLLFHSFYPHFASFYHPS